MGYNKTSSVIYGIKLSKKQYFQLLVEFNQDFFKKVNEKNLSITNHFFFTFEKDVLAPLLDNWSMNIPNTSYKLVRYQNDKKWNGAYIILDSYEESRDKGPVQKLHIPKKSEIKKFNTFIKPYCEKYKIKRKCGAALVIFESY